MSTKRLTTILLFGGVGLFFLAIYNGLIAPDFLHGSGVGTDPSTAAQQRAMKLFPELGVSNSRLNQEFIRRYHVYQKENPAFFQNPEWPTTLARECQAVISPQTLAKNANPDAWMWESKEQRAARDAKKWNDFLRSAPPPPRGFRYAPFIPEHGLDRTPHP